MLVIGVRREVVPLGKGGSEKREETGLYVTSCPLEQHTDADMGVQGCIWFMGP